ncbi:nuclear transport factor 2 family protein [Mycolicibacterium sp. GF69]|uniref:nuclear transport factor 2 family protein n=1 Tax=Mycolicibacterium sp. GF69 TaxID=2267251 RepID=UPI000DCDCA76|nr:nuclear transport factor 2 family protein [Mycolicibacterium sp. GF69]RAV07596.1 nuclear transport factor 2 family protein [Mycolicibacterium sp. GF69]
MNSDVLQRLLDERDIARALYLAARAMDDHDWTGVAEVFADDATGDLGTGPLVGSAAIVTLIRSYLDACGPTQHLLGNVIVDVAGDTAVSRAYVHDLHLSADSAERFYTMGDYHDRWERRSGQWRIVERIKVNRAHVGPLERVFGEM